VLPGVDLVYYGNRPGFEYDLTVAPGTDPAGIRIRYSGAQSIRMTPAGDLVLHTWVADFVQHKPMAFQMLGGVRREVPVSVSVKDGLVGFDFGEFDHSRPLVIDPVITYATYVGGDGHADILAIAVDATGAMYVAGATRSPAIPATPGAYQTSCGDNGTCDNPPLVMADTFIAKFSPDGSTLEYATYLGGGGNDVPTTIAVDAAANAYIGGLTTSTDFPTTSGAYFRTFGPAYGSYLTKLNADGSGLIWSTLLPNNLRHIALDPSSSVYFLSNPLVPGLSTTANAQPVSAPLAPYFGKLDPSGSRLLYATYLSGQYSVNQACGLTVSADGQAWLVGTSGGLLLDYGPCLSPNPGTGQSDGFLFGIDTNTGQLLKSIAWTSQGQTTPIDIGTDAAGNFYVGGFTNSRSFPGINASLLTGNGFMSFVLKLNGENLAPGWTQTFDGFFSKMTTDYRGYSALFTGDAAVGYFTYLDPAGSVLWSIDNPTTGDALAVDAAGLLYVAPNLGTTGNGWLDNPAAKDLGLTGFMRIDPLGGTLLVLPSHFDLGLDLFIGAPFSIDSIGGLPFHASYTVTTATPWLTIENPSGATAGSAFSGSDLGLQTDTTGMGPGTYDGSITVTAPAFTNSPVTVPVRLVIPASPSDLVLPEELVFVGEAGTQFSVLTPFSLLGPWPTGTVITSQTPWIFAYGTTVTANSAGLPEGVNTGQITINAPGQARSPYKIAVTLVITSDSRPAVWPPRLNFNLSENDPSPAGATIVVSAPSPNSVFPFQVTASVPWLHASPGSGSGYALVTLTADPNGLAPGSYGGQATVTSVTPDSAAQTQVNVPVSLTIGNPPFTVAPAALGVIFTPASQPQDVTLSLNSSQPLPFTVQGKSQSQSGTMPADVTLHVPVDSCPNGGQNGCTFGAQQSSVTVTSGTTTVQIPLTAFTRPFAPSIAAGGIVNGASFQAGPVAPGSIIAVFGTDLSASVQVAPPSVLPFNFLPFENVDMLNGPLAPPFFYATPAQLGFQIPWETPSGPNALSVAYDASQGGGSTGWQPFQVAAVAPYIFVWGDDRGAVQNSDTSLNEPSNPAAAGSWITAYLTGQGAVTPAVRTGVPTPSAPLSRVDSTVTAAIDGQSVEVLFAGLTPGSFGLCQANLTVPPTIPPGEHQLVISVGGVNTNAVTISTK
jgi:uncharacterized protein (TIGR03437 family)